jgi:hypothetical protein
MMFSGLIEELGAKPAPLMSLTRFGVPAPLIGSEVMFLSPVDVIFVPGIERRLKLDRLPRGMVTRAGGPGCRTDCRVGLQAFRNSLVFAQGFGSPARLGVAFERRRPGSRPPPQIILVLSEQISGARGLLSISPWLRRRFWTSFVVLMMGSLFLRIITSFLV